MFVTWGTRWTLASNAALLMLTLPVATAVMACIFLRERMTRVRWLSFGFAIVGVVLCSTRDLRGIEFNSGNTIGSLLVFGGVLGSGFYNSYGKKALARHSPLRVLFFTYSGLLILLLPFVLATEGHVFADARNFSVRTWTGLALLTVFHNFLSMVLFLKALKSLDAIQAALSSYLVSALGLPIAALCLGETLGPLAVVGGVLVFASTLVITIWEEWRRGEVPV